MNQSADMPQSLRITVVEDNESLCAVTVELLQQHGHYAVGVSSAEALSDEALDPLIDVLMVDLNLPGEDGVSLLGRYREACPHLTIVVVSSRDQVPIGWPAIAPAPMPLCPNLPIQTNCWP